MQGLWSKEYLHEALSCCQSWCRMQSNVTNKWSVQTLYLRVIGPQESMQQDLPLFWKVAVAWFVTPVHRYVPPLCCCWLQSHSQLLQLWGGYLHSGWYCTVRFLIWQPPWLPVDRLLHHMGATLLIDLPADLSSSRSTAVLDWRWWP